jgi:nitrogen fixation/metabolism regulation signal transduction histidine kinase
VSDPGMDQPEWFTEWLSRDHHEPPDEPVEVGEAARRLARRGRILDWAQIAALVIPVVMSVVVVVVVLVVLGVVHHVDGRANNIVANNGKLTETVNQQEADQRQLKEIATALGRLETARTEDEKLAALAALRKASEDPATTTTTVVQRGGGTTTATTRPPSSAPAATPPPGGGPAPPGPTVPCLLPRSAICPGGP